MSNLRIEDYFHKIEKIIETSPFVQLSNITYEKRGNHEGFIHGSIDFIDGSMLHLREFVDVETKIERLMYVYQYIDPSNKLVFRYDNTGHHKKLRLPTYPHHKHEGSETCIISSNAPDLAYIFDEVGQVIT
jgi:hypothetical protein